MSLLTKSTAFIIGPVATLLGYVMNGIFWVLEKVGIPNIALAIILFTIVIYMLMLPLTYRQQKFSRMTPLMNPELNAIRDKYKGKNDQQSMQRMNEETQLVYAKYGVNPAGSCVQLVIQMIILFPLYRVIMNIPAYVGQVSLIKTDHIDKEAFHRISIRFQHMIILHVLLLSPVMFLISALDARESSARPISKKLLSFAPGLTITIRSRPPTNSCS